jgi:S-adenosylmethionine-dependent methyltransferase
MRDDIGDIADWYDRAVEAEDARLEQHQLEHDLTWRYLARYLPPAGSILEIGAATGRYTLGLCERGYTVTAVELSTALMERCKQRLAAEGLEGRAHCIVADARDLAAVPGTAFDAVLLMGPLYHLIFEDDRRRALREAVDRLRPGGLLVSAHLSRLGVLGDLLKRTPAWIENDAEVRSLLDNGRRPDDAPRGGFRGYFARVAEIVPLHEGLGLETLILAAVEPAISADDASYNALPPRLRERWLDLLFAVSADPTTVGASRHLLYIGRKRGGAADATEK